VAREPQAGPEGERPAPTRRRPRARLGGPERAGLREQLRAVEFPLALRGYERAAVDRYVEQASRLIAELEISASPEAAVRHALAEVGEETRGLLERAHETAEEITARQPTNSDTNSTTPPPAASQSPSPNERNRMRRPA
jgi:DivIVA domain-containing protein